MLKNAYSTITARFARGRPDWPWYSFLVPIKKGSSRFTGERCFDFQEEVSVIPVSIGHPLH
ncbi:hypothetical protein, partial [Serratia marcescens]|uniref:hypothetical protein n=1 Tax=Serratia marcescens TaxID=615 RepID=UPI001E437342